MHVHCGAVLYRLRWHLDAFGGSRESAAQYSAGYRAHLRGDRVFIGGGSFRGTACVAPFGGVFECRYCICVGPRPDLGFLVYPRGRSAGGPPFWFRTPPPTYVPVPLLPYYPT